MSKHNDNHEGVQMPYSELVVRLLEHLADMDGKYAEMVIPVWCSDLGKQIGEPKDGVTSRKVHLAFEELKEAGLVKAERLSSTGRQFQYMRPDITGSGLRFVEALRLQAKAEGEDKSWFWSGVQKAANLSQLVSLVIQAAASAMGIRE